ncbi:MULTISPECIES: GntR family transcriptional regulator [Terribacillus]|jgi:GntR family transcriptional regulator, rspAB operon transcriptional repressor|uniref:GntR family transcriptional regulator n=1 Tax=Terribacillus saccharophilus TaxID=361277 RepID=A0ABX4H161_9BACI|nr:MULTISPECIES: GntR family transcriptional regulator [Terribacillus]PAD36465.1 GntR family transcriptional regulator [Terribacillus saccharophilus]PAD97129.1 GntR family transcriptional regulator [Terribacillus saccharophilus]PAE00877.1 GntR family transcriptional regulator [Terribacillus saccharophilus]VVM32937.1 Transcriptional regulator2C GntR family [Terribacillus sp. AE2B 122]
MKKIPTEKDKEKDASLSDTSVEKEISLLINNIEGLDEYRLPQRAYQIVRLSIRDLILRPGTTILEREMAEVLQMSRTPVREALVRLETEGMVRLVPRRGFIVKPIETEDLEQIYEIVETLDGLAVSLATEKVGELEIGELERLIEQQEQALEQKNLKQWAILDDEFHHLIIDYARNKRLRAVIDTHSDQLYRARLLTVDDRPLPFHSIVEHKAIVACMKAKDGNAASVLMQSHRNRARNEILGVVENLIQN